MTIELTQRKTLEGGGRVVEVAARALDHATILALSRAGARKYFRASGYDPAHGRRLAYVESHRQRFVEELCMLLRQSSISTQDVGVTECAELVRGCWRT